MQTPTEMARADFRRIASENVECEQCHHTIPRDDIELVRGDSAGFYGLLQRCPDCDAVESF